MGWWEDTTEAVGNAAKDPYQSAWDVGTGKKSVGDWFMGDGASSPMAGFNTISGWMGIGGHPHAQAPDHPGQIKEMRNGFEVWVNPPPPAQPTIGDANIATLAQQMDQERQMRFSNPNLTGGQGLLDQPTTASHALLGS